MGFPGGSGVKASACNAGELGWIPGLGRSPGEGNGNPLHYSCLENPMDGGAWWATVHAVAKSRTRLSDFTHSQYICKLILLQSQFAHQWTVKPIYWPLAVVKGSAAFIAAKQGVLVVTAPNTCKFLPRPVPARGSQRVGQDWGTNTVIFRERFLKTGWGVCGARDQLVDILLIVVVR